MMLSTLELLKKIQEIQKARDALRARSPSQPQEKQEDAGPSHLYTTAYKPPINSDAQAKKAAALAKRDKEREAAQMRVPLLLDALKDEFGTQTEEAASYLGALFTPSIKDEINDELLPDRLTRQDPGLSNFGFSRQVYDAILPYAQLAYLIEQNGTPELHAYKLAVLFNDPVKAIQYIQSFAEEHKSDPQPFHNACLFQLPTAGRNWDIDRWRQWVNGGQKPMLNAQFRKCLSRAREIEEKLGSEFKKATPKDIINSYKTLLYKGVTDETLPIAEIFDHYGASQRDFDLYVQEVLPQARLKNMETNNVMIPDTVFDGATVGFPGYYIEKLDHRDRMCPMLGHKTGCCQSIGGQGEPCTIYGITNERSGFYVLRKGNPNNRKPNDDIKAQSWAWRGSNNVLVLDSIEVQNNVLKAKIGEKDGNDLICAMYQGFAKKLIEEDNVPELRVGTAGQTPDKVGKENIPGEQYAYPVDYNGYRDSRAQRSILHKDAMWVEFIDDISDLNEEEQELKEGEDTSEEKPNELFQYLNKLLDDNQNIEIIKIPAMRNFIIWAMKNNPEVLEEFMSQEKMTDSEHQKQFYDFIEKYSSIQNNLSDEDELIRLIESPDTPPEIFELPFNSVTETLPLLHLAVSWGDQKLFNALINKGQNINGFAKDGLTPLTRAICSGSVDFAMMLINKEGIDLNLADREGNTPLMTAIENGQTALIQRLIESSEVDLNAVNFDACTALFFAIMKSDGRTTALLLEQPGIDLLNFAGLMQAIGQRSMTEDALEDFPEVIKAIAPKLDKIITSFGELKTLFDRLLGNYQRNIINNSNVITTYVTDKFEFGALLKTVDDYFTDLRSDFIQSFATVGKLTNSFDDLVYLLSLAEMPVGSRIILIQHVGDKLKTLVTSFSQYDHIVSQLLPNREDKQYFTMVLLDNLLTFELTGKEFLSINNNLPPEQRSGFLSKMSPRFNTFITEPNIFFNTLELLETFEERLAFIELIDNATFIKLFQKGLNLAPVLQRLSDESHHVIIDKLASNIQINAADDFYSILQNISPDASLKMMDYLGEDKSVELLNRVVEEYKIENSAFTDGIFKDKIPPEMLSKLDINQSAPRKGSHI